MLHHLLTRPLYLTAPVSPKIAEGTGELPAARRMTQPDCVIVATGLQLGAPLLVSRNKELAQLQDRSDARRPLETP
jgi:hypothetical protein